MSLGNLCLTQVTKIQGEFLGGGATNSRGLTVLQQKEASRTGPHKVTGSRCGIGGQGQAAQVRGTRLQIPSAKSTLKAADWRPTDLEPAGGAGKAARGGMSRQALNAPGHAEDARRSVNQETQECRGYSRMFLNAPARDQVQKGPVSPPGEQSEGSTGATSRHTAECMPDVDRARAATQV